MTPLPCFSVALRQRVAVAMVIALLMGQGAALAHRNAHHPAGGVVHVAGAMSDSARPDPGAAGQRDTHAAGSAECQLFTTTLTALCVASNSALLTARGAAETPTPFRIGQVGTEPSGHFEARAPPRGV